MNVGDVEKVLFSEEQIKNRVKELGDEINNFYGDTPVFIVSILKGSAPFTMDLIRCLKMDVKLDFIAASSYGVSTTSSGHLTITKDLTLDITGYNVIVIEDIVDSGFTLSKIKEMLQGRGAKSVKIASMLSKPSRRVVPVDIDFLGYEIPDEFVVGYGLDYGEKYRNLPYIGILSRKVY
ncbi:MAG: hypoxanthine phosphoribosyltransferase [Clostridia bacterium]|nr:hypoxanthine phosphoribosyltransferase [Clostridia bacterium]